MPLEEISVEELFKNDEKLREDDVKALLEWLEKQPHLPKISELTVALFLHSCYYSIELAKTTIDTYFTVRTLCPDQFGSRTINDPFIQAGLKFYMMTPLPKRTATGVIVILGKLLNKDVNQYNLISHLKLFDVVTTMYLYEYGPGNGVHIILDLNDVVLGHLLKANPVVLQKFFYYLQEGMPVRLKSFHFINIIPIMDKLMAILKPFLKKELLDMIMLHQGVDPIFKYLPKDIFPQDYGGSSESVEKLSEKIKSRIADNEEFLKFHDSQLVDESKRLGKPKNVSEIFGIQGSFKKLDVD